MESRKLLRSVELPEGVPFRFENLAGLIADALHGDDFAAAAAEIDVASELVAGVDSGRITVRSPLTLQRHSFAVGDGLRQAVMLPDEDVRPVLASYGIELRLIPYGTGPTHWTIENAAEAIASQMGWHMGACQALCRQMLAAASDGSLTVRHPHTDLPYRPEAVRAFYELVTPSDVNAWLEKAEMPMRWSGRARARFVLEAVPTEVPLALQALPDDELVAFEHWRPQSHKPGVRSQSSAFPAGQLKRDIQGQLDRQSEGWFTPREAAHVIARLNPDSDEWDVLRRLVDALGEGKFNAYDYDSRLKRRAGEHVREAMDLLKRTELDAWLRATAGYGFPRAEGASLPAPTARASVAQEAARDLAVRVKPTQAQPAQEAEILRVLRELRHEPTKLPPRVPGKPWVKSEAWAAIGRSQLFASEGVFDKAWERLRAKNEIAERPGL